MNREVVDALIEKYTKPITTSATLAVIIMSTQLILFPIIVLLMTKDYVLLSVIFALWLVDFLYLIIVARKKRMTMYRAVGVSFSLVIQLFMCCSVAAYGIPKTFGIYSILSQIVAMFFEIVCLILGFLYTRRCVKKGIFPKPAASVASSVSIGLPLILLARSIAKTIRNEASTNVQGEFYLIVFTLCGAFMMYAIGMVHLSILYYIKKFNIPDRDLPNQ